MTTTSNPVSVAKRWVQNQSLILKHSKSQPGSSYTTYTSSVTNDQSVLNKNWVHSPETLLYGNIEYTVKFLGSQDVTKPKGTDVIKEAIQKIKFRLQVLQSEGKRIEKVILRISTEGVEIVDLKSNFTLHSYPLHRISFCADDKQDKRVFSFIAKQAQGNAHNCFVFLSDKLAEQITLTIGEAFDLAYRKFIDTNGRPIEKDMKSRQKVGKLESENAELKKRLAQLEAQSNKGGSRAPTATLAEFSPPLSNASLEPLTPRHWETFDESPIEPQIPVSKPPPPPSGYGSTQRTPGSSIRSVPIQTMTGSSLIATPGGLVAPQNTPATTPKTNQFFMDILSSNAPDVGRKLENLDLSGMDDVYDPEFDPRAGEVPRISVSNGNSVGLSSHSNGHGGMNRRDLLNGNHSRGNPSMSNLIESTRERRISVDGSDLPPSPKELEMDIAKADARLAEMRAGFQQGLEMGHTDLHLMNELDPFAVKNGA